MITYVKNEGSNFNAMINALKSIVSCESLGLETKFQRKLFWSCFFPRHVNMAEQMKKCAKISHMFLLSLHKKICKSASLGPKIKGRVERNGKKLVLKRVYTQENKSHH
jgi:hypothetical protein